MSTELDQLAFRFFKLFAQYEYALKAMGYASAGSKNTIQIDWDRFARVTGVLLLQEQDKKIAEARSLLLSSPPKRQVWEGGQVDWRDVPNTDQSSQALFGHICRVRNNLYHGGKFNDRWLAPDRSEELISASLLLLEHLKDINADLREAIKGNKGWGNCKHTESRVD